MNIGAKLGKKSIISFLMASLLLLGGCSDQSNDIKMRIAINPWPGYEFLFLAQEKGFFEEEGLNIELIEMASLADVQRVYVQGRADGIASTMIEAVQAAGITQEPLSVVLIPDYSNGGDIIVANSTIKSVKDLKGKRVGAEIGSLGMFILSQALTREGLSLKDVDIINVEQLNAENSITNNEIDAIVTYPPYSTAIMKHSEYTEIFNTSDIPGDVIDTISIRKSALTEHNPDWPKKFNKAWDKALQYSQKYPQESYQMMADREGISRADFADALTGLKLQTSKESQRALASDQLKDNISKVCSTLEHARSISFKCKNIHSLLTPFIGS